jgi:TAT-translocated FGD2 family F420-dependent dehydrogenase
MPTAFGYVASHEQFPVPLLLDTTVLAEQAGFDAMWASDHFHPWQDTQGHAGHAWISLAALTQRTRSLILGTGVTCPTFRNNPAVVAHAFASLGVLAPGRVFLGVGSGEALNEVPTGGGWGRYAERSARLVEAITIIRALWEEEWVSFHGRYYQIEQARIFDKPPQRVPIYVAAGGPKSGQLAGRHGDGLVTVGGVFGDQGQTVLAAFEEGARAAGKDPATMAKLVEIFAVLGDEEVALPGARLWQFSGAIDGLFEVPDPREIRRIAEERTTPQAVVKSWIVSPDPDVHAAALTEIARHGFTIIFIHAPQEDQHRFIEVYGSAVLPAVRRALGAPSGKG